MNFIALVIDYPTGRRVVCISEKDRKVALLMPSKGKKATAGELALTNKATLLQRVGKK